MADRIIGEDFRGGFVCLGRSRHTFSARAQASECFGNTGPLGCVTEALPPNGSQADLLSSKLLDQHHCAAAMRTKPKALG